MAKKPKKKGRKTGGITYLELVLDQARRIEVAEAKIDERIEAKLRKGTHLDKLFLGIDIIASPDPTSVQAAQQTGRHLLQYVDLHYHGLQGRVVGITTNDNRRVVRDIFITRDIPRTAIDNKTLFELE